jgi:aminoglycoside phosphotransferase (APT) family kinase protein
VNPLHGVLHSHCLELFVQRFGLDARELEADFSGWHKRAILSPSSVFLFPRYDTDVALVEREAAALGVLAELPVVPKLAGLWREPQIGPYPFLETERRFGTSLDDLIEDDLSFAEVGDVLERLGAATAVWHDIDVAGLPDVLRSPPEPDPWLEVLGEGAGLRERLGSACETLAARLPRDVAPAASWVDTWDALLAPLAALAPVLTHGDVHETQVLVDDELELVAVLDWDHSGVAHPVRDFNFGEWGFEIFAWEERFDELYRRYWDGYRSRRTVDLPDHRSVLLFRTLGDALWSSHRLDEQPESWLDALRLRRCAEHVHAVTRSAE